MTESTLAMGYADFRRRVAGYLGWGRNDSNWSTDQSDRLDEILKSGLNQFYYPNPELQGEMAHRWTFLRPVGNFTTIAAYSTGTVSSSGTTVTLTDGTWPSWAATHGTLIVSGTRYTVSSRTSDSEIELSSAPSTAFSSDTYSLEYDNDYDLEDDFGGLVGRITFNPDDACGNLEKVDEAVIRDLREISGHSGRPQKFAVRPKVHTGASGQRYEIMLWPMADSAYVLTYPYSALPNALSSSYPYPYGGAVHSLTILESCLAVAELEENGIEGGPHGNAFQRMLRASIDYDLRVNCPDFYGYNGDYSRSFQERHGGVTDITYNGESIP